MRQALWYLSLDYLLSPGNGDLTLLLSEGDPTYLLAAGRDGVSKLSDRFSRLIKRRATSGDTYLRWLYYTLP